MRHEELVGTGPRRCDCFWAFKSVVGEKIGQASEK